MSFYGSHPQYGITRQDMDQRRRAAGLPPCRMCNYFGRVFAGGLYRCARCSSIRGHGCVPSTEPTRKDDMSTANDLKEQNGSATLLHQDRMAHLQEELLAEQVRELRLKNDAQEMANQHLSKPLPDMLSMYKKDA